MYEWWMCLHEGTQIFLGALGIFIVTWQLGPWITTTYYNIYGKYPYCAIGATEGIDKVDRAFMSFLHLIVIVAIGFIIAALIDIVTCAI